MSYFQNTCKPVGLGGKIMVAMMNLGHSSLTQWALSHITIKEDDMILDAGCGGGANIKRMLTQCTSGVVKGIDYSEVSVEKSKKLNKDAINNKRCEIIHSNVLSMPFEKESFNLVTAIETIYFWPEIENSFKEIYRVIKPGGKFLICNELNGGKEWWQNIWPKLIDGMAMYNKDDVTKFLEQAGFKNIQVYNKRNRWMCLTADK